MVAILPTFKDLLPNSRIGFVYATVSHFDSTQEFENELATVVSGLKDRLLNSSEKEFPIINETRKAYKICGKEPSRYRPSSEALIKRIRTEKGLYRINNIVDTINLLSLSSHYSIGGFDSDCIEGDAVLAVGNADPYLAIGRGELNIEFMPGMRDDVGFFGTPTSDSQRTMVTPNTRNLVLVYYDFMGNVQLEESLAEAIDYLTRFCDAKDCKTEIIS